MAMNRTHGTLVFTTKKSGFHGCSDPQMPDGTIKNSFYPTPHLVQHQTMVVV
jgi:hypothetical protein